jgi:MYXO-CTERM domain-containing protein
VAALGGAPQGRPPRVALRAEPSRAQPGERVRLSLELSDPDGGALEVRWDDGYDGTWDTDYAAPAERTIDVETTGVLRWKVRARDATGRIAEAVARVQVAVPQAPPTDAGGQVDAGPGDGGMVAPPASGCGCRAAGGSPLTAGGLACFVLALLVRRRRR